MALALLGLLTACNGTDPQEEPAQLGSQQAADRIPGEDAVGVVVEPRELIAAPAPPDVWTAPDRHALLISGGDDVEPRVDSKFTADLSGMVSYLEGEQYVTVVGNNGAVPEAKAVSRASLTATLAGFGTYFQTLVELRKKAGQLERWPVFFLYVRAHGQVNTDPTTKIMTYGDGFDLSAVEAGDPARKETSTFKRLWDGIATFPREVVVVVLIDTCFSGGAFGLGKGPFAKPNAQAYAAAKARVGGLHVLTSTDGSNVCPVGLLLEDATTEDFLEIDGTLGERMRRGDSQSDLSMLELSGVLPAGW